MVSLQVPFDRLELLLDLLDLFVVWVNPNEFFPGFSSGFEILRLKLHPAEILQGLGMICLQFEGVVKQIDRLPGVSRIEVGSAEVRHHVRILIVQGHRLFIPADGQIEAAHIVVGISQRYPSLDIILVFSRVLFQPLELLNELGRRMVLGKRGLALSSRALRGGDTCNWLDEALAQEEPTHKTHQNSYDEEGDLLILHLWPYVNIARHR